MPIELAPHNKRGLTLASPIMAGSGAVGNGDSWPPGLQPADFGALVTSPVSMRPRKGAPQPRWVDLPAGFLLDTGGHNPGFSRLIDSQAGLWRRSPVPVIISLAEGDTGGRVWMAARLEEENLGVSGIELSASEDINLGEASAFISSVRHATTLPILVRLPATRAAHLAETCVVAGADALVVGTPPPVVYPADDGALLEAPLGGPAALPFTLRALRNVAALSLGVPLVAAGGVHSLDDVALCLELGASAVQIRSLVWTNPRAAHLLCQQSLAFMPDEDE